MIDPLAICSACFWEDRSPFIAGEWEGVDPPVPDGSVLFRTSGSTADARWIVLGKKGLLLSARAVNAWLDVREDSKWGLALPLNHVGGFGVLARAFSARCGLACFEGKWDPERFARWVETERVTHVSLVPTQVHDLVGGGFPGPESLRAVVVGGGHLDSESGQAARDAGWPVLASYGMTEAGSQIATQRLELLEITVFRKSLEDPSDLERSGRPGKGCFRCGERRFFPDLPGWRTGTGSFWRGKGSGSRQTTGFRFRVIHWCRRGGRIRW